MIARRDILDRPDELRPAILHQLAGHAPDDRGRLRFRDGPPALLAQPRHGIGAVAPHPGHQDADQLARRHNVRARCVTIRSTLGCQG